MENDTLNHKIETKKNKARILNKKNLFRFLFLGMMVLAIFLRSYHFSDWLHFELDQARDAEVVSEAVIGGINNLPLLGPRAQGTFLRLGPAFYYLSYLSAKVSGNTPPGIASGVLVLSVLALPIFYLYFRRYFDKKISIILVFLAGASAFLIVYSRFAWNPNYLVFFVPLSFYAMLRAVDTGEKRRNIWLIISFAALSISTQLHFLAFIILPIVFFIFLLVKRPKLKLIVWSLAILSALLFYAPVFINETMTGGDNTEQFFGAITDKSEKNEAGLAKKVFLNLKEHSAGYFLMLSGRDGNSLLGLNLNGIASYFRRCDENDCPQDYYLGLISAMFLVSGFSLLVLRWKRKTDSVKKDFLFLNGTFFFISFAIFTPLALSISPRFFLLGAFMPFIFLGLIFETISKKYYLDYIIPAMVLAVLIFSNGKEAASRFFQLAGASQNNIKIENDSILKEKTRVTYSQEKQIAEYMMENQKKNGYPILFYGETRYVSAIAYIFERKNVLFNDRINHDKIYRYVNYFWVDYRKPDNQYKIGKKEESFYDIAEIKNFGTLAVLKLIPKEEAITDDYKIFDDRQSKSSGPKRYNWSEITLDED